MRTIFEAYIDLGSVHTLFLPAGYGRRNAGDRGLEIAAVASGSSAMPTPPTRTT